MDRFVEFLTQAEGQWGDGLEKLQGRSRLCEGLGGEDADAVYARKNETDTAQSLSCKILASPAPWHRELPLLHLGGLQALEKGASY
jgi:hypothetical protein